LKPVIVSTFDIAGGAARAANRLHKALMGSAIDSSMVVMNKKLSDQSILEIHRDIPDITIDKNYIIRKLIQRYYIDISRSSLSNTLFSFAYLGYDISSIPLIRSADIINIHWVGMFQSPITLYNLMKLGKPIVWTLHDMNPFTGGCHYSANCDGYTRECLDCPQLVRDPYSLPNAILRDKSELFSRFPLTIVTPSHWLADCASKSTLFRRSRIEVIPYSIETDIYTPMSKKEAKSILGIDPQSIVLMFGADSSNEKRKGFAELEAALELARTDPEFDELVSSGRMVILSLGPITADVASLGIKIKALGRVDDDLLIARAYSSADIFILPSLEDNLPNMMLESLACGTPVIAFETGGIPDVVQNDVNGCLVPVRDVDALAVALIKLVLNTALRKQMSVAAVAYAHKAFAPKIQADRYIALFDDLLKGAECNQPNVMADINVTSRCSMAFGPNFDVIRHKIMLDALLKGIPEICQAYVAQSSQEDNEQIIALRKNIDELSQSLSWRITAPFRKILAMFKMK